MTPLEAALEAIDRYTLDPVVRANVRGLTRAYDARWRDSPWRVAAVEEEFATLIVNPATGRRSRAFTFAGRRDGEILSESGDRWLLEHKTCSEDIADPNSPYFSRLAIDAQVNAYMLSAWQEGRKLAGTLYDVIRRPSIRPKQLAGSKLIETPDQFEERLVADAAERPSFYFARKAVYRIDKQLIDFAGELWDVAREIKASQVAGTHYRNTGACMQWNRPCPYLGLCSDHDTPDSDRWQKKPVHSELDSARGNLDVLTHSRVGTFKTCRRKHHYRYELGLVRRDEDSESMFFGTVIHAVLAEFWNRQPREEGVSNDCTPAGGETAGTAGRAVEAASFADAPAVQV